MTTIEQLARLAELAPDVCVTTRYHNGVTTYFIGDCIFWQNNDEFTARLTSRESCIGQPALDWLQCALQRVIKARGINWELRYWKPRDQYEAEVANQTKWADTAADALLSALINTLEVEK